MTSNVEKPATAAAGMEVLHVVGFVTEAVHTFLKPATSALASAGVPQTVVLMGDDRRSTTERLDPAVTVIALPRGAGRLANWWLLVRTTRAYIARGTSNGTLRAVHVHGLLPALLLAALRRTIVRAGIPVFCSPHSSRLLGTYLPVGALALRIFRPFRGPHAQRLVVGSDMEARQWAGLVAGPVPVIPAPVAGAFFEHAHAESSVPVVIGSAPDGAFAGARLFAQLAVLMGEPDSHIPVRFEWEGGAGREAAAVLDAAEVAIAPVEDTDARVRTLAKAWAYVAAGDVRGFSSMLAEAMALGVPCVAVDTPRHREMIEHGVDGFVCTDLEGMLKCLAELRASAPLRERVGRAARAKALRRFDDSAFTRSMQAFYEGQ